MLQSRFVPYVLVVSLATAGAALAPTPSRAEAGVPFAGQVSDEVILQRLRTEGVADPQVVSRHAGRTLAKGTRGGRQVQFEVDTASGRIVDVSGPERRAISAGSSAPPAAGSTSTPPDPGRIADPKLMRNTIK